MIPSYIIGGLLASSLALGGFAWVQTSRLENSQSNLRLANAELQTCGGRLDAVLRDVRSDNEIDTLPDSALRDVHPSWLRDPDSP